LSLRDALIAIVVGAVAGNVLLGLAGLIGADARVPGMVVLRAPLGRRGSYAPTVVNVAQNLGWSTFELIVISTAAAALSKKGFGLGILLVLSRNVTDAADVPAAVAAGGAVSAFALLALTVDESDEAFADIYSTAVSIQNVLPRVSQRLLIVVVSAAATIGAIVINLRSYQSFLLLLGSVFVPLFGVLLADCLLAGAHYREHDFFSGPA